MKSIEINHLVKKYGDFTAVNDISFSVMQGEFVGFLGVNGAGKSTTINIMSTLLEPTEGTIRICGYELSEDRQIRKNIGVVYQENVLDDLLTVEENLICRGVLHGITKKQAREKMLELSKTFGIDDLLKKRYKYLSGGQKRRCEIVSALIHTPKILFLDEPTTGLDPAARIEVWNTVKKMREKSNMTVFLTTHYMEEASCADKIIIIDKGNLIATGTPFELKEKYAFDCLKIHTTANIEQELGNLEYKIKNDEITIKLSNTKDAIEILDKVKEKISGFEVIQGTLDDVFINATGGLL